MKIPAAVTEDQKVERTCGALLHEDAAAGTVKALEEALREAHYALREAKFILLGSGGSLLERAERTAAHLDVSAKRALEVLE